MTVLDHERIATEPCGCRLDKPTGTRVHLCEQHAPDYLPPTCRPPKWIHFEVCVSPAHQRLRTTVWRVLAKDGDVPLGEIRWYAPWRKYTFRPGPRATVFDPSCLRDIAAFVEEQMAARKAARS